MLVANKAEKWIRFQKLADEEAVKKEAEQFVKSKLGI